MIRFLYRMPMSVRIADGTTKNILRKVMSGLLPADAMNRPKSPFGLPAARRLQFKGAGLDFKKPALKHLFWKHYDRVSGALLDGAYRDEKIFKQAFIQKLLDQQTDKEGCGFNVFLWKLWNFSEWYGKWLKT
jgi:asparagine synthetase B (glutamine-hydrolysing)